MSTVMVAPPTGSGQPMSPRRTTASVVAVVAIVASMLALPVLASQDMVFTVGSAACSVVLALSFNIIFGYGGIVSFGHAALFAIGGYVGGIALNTGQTFWVALAVAGVAGVIVGLLFAAVARRASGIYFAIITLALGQVVFVVAQQWADVTGGISGLSVSLPELDLGVVAVPLSTPNAYYRVVVVAVAILIGLLYLLSRTRFTRLLKATRDDDVRAGALGVDVYRFRVLAFTWSALFAALAGALYAPLGGLVYPELAKWDASAEPILATLLGGSGAFWGPAIGAVVFAALDYVTRDLHSLRIVITGSMLLAVLLAAPGGLVGMRDRLRARRARSESGPSAPRSRAAAEKEPGDE